MPLGYVIAQIRITDPQAYPICVAPVRPTVDAFGDARPQVRDVMLGVVTRKAARGGHHWDLDAEAKVWRPSGSRSVQTLIERVA